MSTTGETKYSSHAPPGTPAPRLQAVSEPAPAHHGANPSVPHPAQKLSYRVGDSRVLRLARALR